MKFFAAAVASLAATASAFDLASMSEQEINTALTTFNTKFAEKAMASGSDCADCARSCSDPSNGVPLGMACFIVKCGNKV